MKHPLISVIMPTYNRAYIIEKAIDSILNQTYKNLELIIIDDCSSDNTEDVIKKYKDKRLKYIKLEKNSGANYARNIGIDNAKGEYITFQDSDDLSFNNRLEVELNELLKNNVDWVFTSFKKIDGKKEKIIPLKKINSNEIQEKILYSNFVTTQVLFGKKEIFEDVKFDSSLPRFQDWDLAIRISKKYKGFHINKVFLNMYIQNDSITKNPNKGLIALNLLKNKYSNEMNNKQKARIICRIGKFKFLCGEENISEFKESFLIHKNPKYLIIHILYKLKILKKVIK